MCHVDTRDSFEVSSVHLSARHVFHVGILSCDFVRWSDVKACYGRYVGDASRAVLGLMVGWTYMVWFVSRLEWIDLHID